MTLGDLQNQIDDLVADYGIDQPAVGFIRLATTDKISRECLEDTDDIDELLGVWMTKHGEPD